MKVESTPRRLISWFRPIVTFWAKLAANAACAWDCMVVWVSAAAIAALSWAVTADRSGVLSLSPASPARVPADVNASIASVPATIACLSTPAGPAVVEDPVLRSPLSNIRLVSISPSSISPGRTQRCGASAPG